MYTRYRVHMYTNPLGEITDNIRTEADKRGWDYLTLAAHMGYEYVPAFLSPGDMTVKELFDTAAAFGLAPSELTK